MANRLRSERSTEAPMDFQFTNRPNSDIKPVWATSSHDPQTPQKRSRNDTNPSIPSFPTFGTNQNVPFLFNSPLPQTPHSPAWAPPSNLSPAKSFPQEELKDVDMAEPSPPRKEEPHEDGERAVSFGGLKRVFKRRKERDRARQAAQRRRRVGDSDGSDESDEESDEDGRASPRKSRVQRLSHHYTLNMASHSTEKADLPYVLLGYVQFAFNLSLLLMFLYLVVQFILTIQRDVQYRVSEYSMETVQEISNCASQYRANRCGEDPVPAMLQQCGRWETCMNRDPTMVGRSRVSAELIGEVVNGFFEPISWKTMFFTVSSLAFLTLFINSLLSLYRSRHLPSSSAPNLHHQPSYPIPAPPGPYASQYNWPRPWSGVEDDDEQFPRKRRLESGEAAKIK